MTKSELMVALDKFDDDQQVMVDISDDIFEESENPINKDYQDNLATTTAYIYAELEEKPLFFSDIDRVLEIAEGFIKKFPTGTDWEKTGEGWEHELYKFWKSC